MNRLKVLSFVSLFLLAFATAEAQHKIEISEKDGTDWLSAPESYRVGYVSGYILGLSLMKNNTFLYLPRYGSEEFEKAPLMIMGALRLAMAAADELSLSNITVGQITDGLDSFYADFSTRRIKIVDAIYVVKMQVSGNDSDLIAAQVRYLKMQPIGNEPRKRVEEKFKSIPDVKKALQTGEITAEEFLTIGGFFDKNGESHSLFCYGKY